MAHSKVLRSRNRAMRLLRSNGSLGLSHSTSTRCLKATTPSKSEASMRHPFNLCQFSSRFQALVTQWMNLALGGRRLSTFCLLEHFSFCACSVSSVALESTHLFPLSATNQMIQSMLSLQLMRTLHQPLMRCSLKMKRNLMANGFVVNT